MNFVLLDCFIKLLLSKQMLFIFFLLTCLLSQCTDKLNCTNKPNGAECGDFILNKICQDNICICEHFDPFLCTSCGLPIFYDFKQHDDSIINITFNYTVTHTNSIFDKFEWEYDIKLLSNSTITLTNNKINSIDMFIGEAIIKFRSLNNNMKICVTYPTVPHFGSFAECENTCYDNGEEIKFRYYDGSSCSGYEMPNNCKSIEYEVVMKINNIVYGVAPYINTISIIDKKQYVCVKKRCGMFDGYADCHNGICLCDNYDRFICRNCGFIWFKNNTEYKFKTFDDSIPNITLKQIVKDRDNTYYGQITLFNNLIHIIHMRNTKIIIGFRSLNKLIEVCTSYYDKEICVHKCWNNEFVFTEKLNYLLEMQLVVQNYELSWIEKIFKQINK